MPYTEAVLLEIQRISSVAPMSVRSPIADQKFGSYIIPKVLCGVWGYRNIRQIKCLFFAKLSALFSEFISGNFHNS